MKKILPSLNGLRAISILLVITSHLQIQYAIFPRNLPTYLFPIRYLFEDGHLGVSVFFIISGFLITTLLLNEEDSYKSVSLKKFYIRRTLRIFPAYYTLLLFYFILQSLGYINLPKYSWLSSLTYTKYFNWYLDWYTAHCWSLSIEEHFYLVWPLLFIMGDKVRK